MYLNNGDLVRILDVDIDPFNESDDKQFIGAIQSIVSIDITCSMGYLYEVEGSNGWGVWLKADQVELVFTI